MSVAPEIDDERIDAIVNDVFYGDHELHLLGQRIIRRQDRLREVVSGVLPATVRSGAPG